MVLLRLLPEGYREKSAVMLWSYGCMSSPGLESQLCAEKIKL